jgi:hypothetical protein
MALGAGITGLMIYMFNIKREKRSPSVYVSLGPIWGPGIKSNASIQKSTARVSLVNIRVKQGWENAAPLK